MAFNLDSLAKRDTAELHLRHPVTDELLYDEDDKAKPVKIVLFGTSSKQYRNAIASIQNARLKRGKKPVTAETLRQEDLDLLVACSDRGVNIEYKGKPLQGEVFRDLYEDDSYDWLRSQVDECIADVKGFLEQ